MPCWNSEGGPPGPVRKARPARGARRAHDAQRPSAGTRLGINLG